MKMVDMKLGCVNVAHKIPWVYLDASPTIPPTLALALPHQC